MKRRAFGRVVVTSPCCARVQTDGKRDVLGSWIGRAEVPKFWLEPMVV
jgi:hypothetical protein